MASGKPYEDKTEFHSGECHGSKQVNCVPCSAVPLIHSSIDLHPTGQEPRQEQGGLSPTTVPSSAIELCVTLPETFPDSSEEDQRGESQSDEDCPLSAIEVMSDYDHSAVKIRKTGGCKGRKLKPKHVKVKPNAFIALPIKSSSIKKQVENLQYHLITKEPRIKDTLIPLNKLHITLMVIRLETENDIVRAKHALSEAVHFFQGQPLELSFSGLASFHNNVLYADVNHEDKEKLQAVASHIWKTFELNGILSTDHRKTFTAHMTIAKVSRQHKVLLSTISQDLYADWTASIGCESVEGLELLSMTKADESGYYFCYARQSLS